jgi:hypothetical protein
MVDSEVRVSVQTLRHSHRCSSEELKSSDRAFSDCFLAFGLLLAAFESWWLASVFASRGYVLHGVSGWFVYRGHFVGS